MLQNHDSTTSLNNRWTKEFVYMVETNLITEMYFPIIYKSFYQPKRSIGR